MCASTTRGVSRRRRRCCSTIDTYTSERADRAGPQQQHMYLRHIIEHRCKTAGKNSLFYVFLLAVSTYLLEYRRYLAPTNIQLLHKEIEDEAQEGYALAMTPKVKSTDDSNSDTSHDEVMVAVPRREKSFTPVSIAFTDLWYSVPNPTDTKETLDLLKGISGYATPDDIDDVIAGRKTEGTIHGKIFLNGYEANDLAIRRATGYCEQMYVHSEASTMREALTFSAFLRQDSSIPDSKKYDTVDECLDLLDMHDIADAEWPSSDPD
ncbi:ATP-binding Cassette (ABC) Superfamily [Phytophthora infestans T30-4]|uniref:ATP-binding Cassette (ABC) Superfamily n=1 Tax=Phytophthora infestans (strain T30-4) TaxID=403677 RepID=D0N485_PHYIT|nr:ATP-binding Cassette (ABC) Superfamily [Phytophthora infestans T30-4]EEY69189.1 ATP-binding Cassette (ABC) Superfamily [Phytophthora infestans T30-4]|eukprot:XP_002999043.1 ATP-binding Cassette (ABC) Superfamily [Phytophthora infestans T30-4]